MAATVLPLVSEFSDFKYSHAVVLLCLTDYTEHSELKVFHSGLLLLYQGKGWQQASEKLSSLGPLREKGREHFVSHIVFCTMFSLRVPCRGAPGTHVAECSKVLGEQLVLVKFSSL